MRYLYVVAIVLFAGFYTFSQGSTGNNFTIVSGDDDDKKGDDDDDDDGDAGAKNYLEVEAQTGLNFSVTGPNDFENPQTKTNAIKLKFKTKDKDCSVYAKVSDYTTPKGADKSNIPLELELRNDNGKKTMSLVTTAIQLTNYDQRLFVQPKDKQAFNFFYDLRLQPLGYDYPEGQYNFTILFTMTQP